MKNKSKSNLVFIFRLQVIQGCVDFDSNKTERRNKIFKKREK